MKENNKIKVGLLFGGKSVEHEISILTTLQVYHAIDQNQYDVIPLYLSKNNQLLTSPSFLELSSFQHDKYKDVKNIVLYNINDKVYYQEINKKKPLGTIDIIIVTAHGAGVEDGTLAGYLDLLNIPYTSTSLLPSAICQDKIWTKILLKEINIPQIDYIYITKQTYLHKDSKEIITRLGLPIMVKPTSLGSSIGVYYAKTKEDLNIAINNAFRFSSRILLEKGLENYREFNQAIFKEIKTEILSAIEEVKPTNEILSFIDKYENNLNKLSSQNRIIPAIISTELQNKISELTKKVYEYLNLDSLVRIDYLYDIDTDTLYLNEINTIPGSLSFYLYDKENIDFTTLINKLIKNAFFNHSQKQKFQTSFKSNVLSNQGSKLTK